MIAHTVLLTIAATMPPDKEPLTAREYATSSRATPDSLWSLKQTPTD